MLPRPRHLWRNHFRERVLNQLRCCGRRGIGQHHGKLIPAHAAKGIFLADVLAQSTGHGGPEGKWPVHSRTRPVPMKKLRHFCGYR